MPTLIVIAGPTASGKTALAVRLAKVLDTEILSADSRQCYRELSIGVAAPSAAEMEGIKHYFIHSHSVCEEVNAGVYENYGLETLKTIFSSHEYAVLVGGTGLYIKSLCEGIDEMPHIAKKIRNGINEQYTNRGLEWLQEQVKKEDPEFWMQAEQSNPHRLIRALEMIRATGQSIMTFRQQKKAVRPFNICKFAIAWPRQELVTRIETRVDMMMQAGLLDEVRSLSAFKNIKALQTVGYQELFAYLNGECSLEDAVAKIKTNTRKYAKRQMTWFKKDKAFQWITPSDLETILQSLPSK